MKIYLSYCHKNMEIADTIDKDFKARGFLLIRDIRVNKLSINWKDSNYEY